MLLSLNSLIQDFNLNLTGVLHVGAHKAEERNAYLQYVPENQICWLEAQPLLVKYLRETYPKMDVWPVLVSNTDNTNCNFMVTSNGESSSMLELAAHRTEHPHVVEVNRLSLTTQRLDTFLKQHPCPNANFLNLDIQGAELKALQGLGQYLKQFDYIYTEVNEKILYYGCALLPELDAFLKDYIRVRTKMTCHGWGDALYVKRALM